MDIKSELIINDKNRVMQSSFFDECGFPKPFFKKILDENDNCLRKSIKHYFPYNVDFERKISVEVNAKSLWIYFYGEIFFENEEDAIVLKTLRKLMG